LSLFQDLNILFSTKLQVQAGRKLVPTSLGITLIRGYQCIDPDLCLPDIRSFIEQQITLVAKGQMDHFRVVQHVLQQFKQKFTYFVKQVRKFHLVLFFSPLSFSFTTCSLLSSA
jgi:DNA topoisomerase-3